MSCENGLLASIDLKRFLRFYFDSSVRGFKVLIKNEELVVTHFEKVTGSWKEDFEQIVSRLILPAQPAYILFRLDTKNETSGYDWLLLSWCPDDSPMRQKLLLASSKATLKQEFGRCRIKEEYHATSMDDVSFQSLEQHCRAVKLSAPQAARKDNVAELFGNGATGVTEFVVGGKSRALSRVPFPFIPDALTAGQQLLQKEMNYTEFKIDVSPKSSKCRSRSVPTFKTSIETDTNSNTIELKLTIPIPEQAERSLSVACLITSSEELFSSGDSSSSYHEEQSVSSDQEFNNLKSLCISGPDSLFLNSANSSGFLNLCVDGTVNRNSDSNSEESNILTDFDPSVSEVNKSRSAIYNFDFCDEDESSESDHSLKLRKIVPENLKRKAERNAANLSKVSKKLKVTTSANEYDPEEASIESTKSSYRKGKSSSSINASISKLNKYIEQLSSVENNNIDCEQTMPILESVLKEILTLKGVNVSLSGKMHRELLKSLIPFLNIEDVLVNEKRNFAPKYLYPLIMLSAETVFIILSSHSDELSYDEVTVLQMASFVFNNYFNSLLPVILKSSRKGDPLSEVNFDKTYGKNSFRSLLNRFEEIISLFSKIPEIVSVSDEAFSKLTSVCSSCFFTPNILNLQHSCLKLITAYFTLFDEKQGLILDHIITTIALLNSDTKFIVRSFMINHSDTKLQFITVALLHFINGTANFLKTVVSAKNLKELYPAKKDQISKLFSLFLCKMIHNSVLNNNFKSILENVIADVLKIRCQPEWPTCNFILRYLHKTIAFYLWIDTSDKKLQNICVDYLTLILPPLRQDFVLQPSIFNALTKIAFQDDQNGGSKNTEVINIVNSDSVCCIKLVIQILANCKNSKSLRDLIQVFCILLLEEMLLNISKFKGKVSKVKSVDKQCSQLFSFVYEMVQCLRDSQDCRVNSKPIFSNFKDEEIVKTVSRYLNSSNRFVSNFEKFLKFVINRVCDDANPQIQSKSINCMISIIEVDPNLLFFSYVELAINRLVTHRLISVRERLINFLGDHISKNEDFSLKYFKIISGRILDVNVRVRKSALSYICKVCLVKPEQVEISETLVKILKRLHDEPPVVKVIVDFFKVKWIEALNKGASNSILPTIIEILSIMKLAHVSGAMNHFEKLFKTFVSSTDLELKEASLRAYKRIAKCILNQMLKNKMLDSESLINCYRFLLLIISTKSEFVIDLTPRLYPHLCSKFTTEENTTILDFVLKFFELMFLWHRSYFQDNEKKLFLMEHFIRLMNSGGYKIAVMSTYCFSLISKINNDFSSAVLVFVRCQRFLKRYHNNFFTEDAPGEKTDENNIERTLVVLGALIKHINFSGVRAPNFNPSIVKETAQMIVDLLISDSKNRSHTLKAFQLISVRFSCAILNEKIISLFCLILKHSDHSIELKIQVLNIINSYLQEDNLRSKLLNDNWSKLSKKEDLKSMKDVSAGAPSVIAQCYLPSILNSYLVSEKDLRVAVVKTVFTIAKYSLVHPANFLSYSVCMSADLEPLIASIALEVLKNIQETNASFVRPYCLKGIVLSVKLLQKLSLDELVRGFIIVENIPSSRFSKLYESLPVKDQNFIISSMLNQFNADDDDKLNLSVFLYLADNLAYFPYKEVNDVLLIMFQISTTICNNAEPLFLKIQHALIENRKSKNNNIDEKNNSSRNRKQKSQKEIVDNDINHLSSSCAKGFAYVLLLQLWYFLKSYYSISNKCILQHLSGSLSKVKKSTTRNLKLESFNPESVVHYLKSRSCSPLHNKENITGTPLIKILKCLNSEFEELSSQLITENPDDL